MSLDAPWIPARISEARKPYPLVTEAVAARIDELLQGQLSDEEFSRAELTTVATALIADMARVGLEAKADQ